MKKIPVGQTIVHAYRFAFGEFVSLVRVSWLPLVPAVIANTLVQPQLSALSRALVTRDFSAITMPWALLLLLYAGALVLGFMQITAVFQYAMGRPEAARHRWFYFSVGKPLWRVLGSLLMFVLTMGALLVVYMLAVIAISYLFGLGFHAAHMTDAGIETATEVDTGLAFLAGYCAMIFCAVRFGFLLFAATIALDRIALFQSWLTSNRNFWRMFGIALAVFLPLFAVLMLLLYLGGAFPPIPTGATPAQIQAIERTATGAFTARIEHYWYLYLPASAVITILITGLAAGAQSFAWRALMEDTRADDWRADGSDPLV